MPRALVLHTVFETLGYGCALAVYALLRARRGDAVADRARLNVIAGAAVGAAIGCRLLVWLSYPALAVAHRTDLRFLLGGKTIVGGLLGGWIGVEIAKRLSGVTTRTGDLFVLPLTAAMAIGRIGCFLAGPADNTAGLPTSLPWGIAMGDRVRRHPVALYEIAFLLALAPLCESVRRRAANGDAFRVFIGAYCAFRFFVDFLKPEPPPVVLGLSAIQVACAIAIAAVLIPSADRARLRAARPLSEEAA